MPGAEPVCWNRSRLLPPVSLLLGSAVSQVPKCEGPEVPIVGRRVHCAPPGALGLAIVAELDSCYGLERAKLQNGSVAGSGSRILTLNRGYFSLPHKYK